MSDITFRSYELVTAGSLAGNYTSAALDVSTSDSIGIQLVWTSTAAGTFAVQVSNDVDKDAITNWNALTLSAVPTAAGSADTYAISLSQVPFKWLRIVYTRTSGSGSLGVIVTGKGI